MEGVPKLKVEPPQRPETDTSNNALLFASRFRSLLIQYGVGKYFRPFHRKYTKPEDFPKMHVITLKDETPGGPAGIVYRHLQVEVELANATIKLFDFDKQVLISFSLDVNRKPYLMTDSKELDDLRMAYSKYDWPESCPRIPDQPFCVYLVNREEPLLFWHQTDLLTLQSFAVVVFLIYATRSRLEQEIAIQDDFSLAIEDAIRESALAKLN